MPQLSIIIPTFNCEATLESCLRSVREQSWKDFEVIVQDADSQDSTREILQSNADLIDDLHVEPDQGVYDAMNRGIRRARGTWLLFLGADDQLANPGVLESVFPIKSDSQFIYGNVELRGSGIVGRHGQIYDGRFSKWKLCRKNICHQSILYRNTLFEQLGEFDISYPTLSDWLFNIRAFAHQETRPEFADVVLASYCLEGLSNRIADPDATRARVAMIRQIFGFSYWVFANLHVVLHRLKNRIHVS